VVEGEVRYTSLQLSWVDWNTVCRGKEVGGLGVRRIREFNLALLGRWGWWLLIDSSSLWIRVLASRYGMEGGAFKGVAERPQLGGVTFMLCAGNVGLVII